jgi:transcription initiation factor TFIID subunit TAF12
LSAVTLATRAARQHKGETVAAFSMASLKRRAFKQHLIDRMDQQVAQGYSLEQSSPDDAELCHYGTIIDLVPAF